MGALHPRLGPVDEQAGDGRAALALGRQAPRQLGGDGRRAVEQPGGGGDVLPPEGVGEASEQLVQVLAEGALLTAEGPQPELVVGQVAAAALGADQQLQAPGVAGMLRSRCVGVSAACLTGGDGRAGSRSAPRSPAGAGPPGPGSC